MEILKITKDTEIIKSNMEKATAENNLSKFDHALFGIYIEEENNEKHVHCIFSDKFEIEFTVDKKYDVMSAMVDDLLLRVLTKNYPTELTEFDKTELTKCINITAGRLAEEGKDISIMNDTNTMDDVKLAFRILNHRTVTAGYSPDLIRHRLMAVDVFNKDINRIIDMISDLLDDNSEYDKDQYRDYTDKLIAALNWTDANHDEIYDDEKKIELAKLIDGLIILFRMMSSSLIYVINHPTIMQNEAESEPASEE